MRRADAAGGLQDAFPSLYSKYGRQFEAMYDALWSEDRKSVV